MTLILSVQEFLKQQLLHQGGDVSVFKAYKIPLNDPKGISKGYRRLLTLRPGLNLLIDDYSLHESLKVETEGSEVPFSLEFSFMLFGKNANEEVHSGENFLNTYWGISEVSWFEWQTAQVLKLDIHIECGLFETLILEQYDGLPLALKQTLDQSDLNQLFVHYSLTTSAMQLALNQILQCPYQGMTQRLYLESKALELIALRLEQLLNNTEKSSSQPVLQSDDIDRIYYAREILLSRLDRPPSLLELARRVGLNDYKLKAGFRQMFGTTVFGCLYEYRMEQAQRLLIENQIKIQDLARQMGYASPSRFTAAFKKRFGVTPGKYRSEKKSVWG